MATIKRKGFGQVEPNHISGNVDGSIYAQRPIDTGVMGEIIENGRFAKYAVDKVTTVGDFPWLMIYNEVKLYDERENSLKDYAMKAVDFIGGELTPRLIEINVGDIFTTNTFKEANTDNKSEVKTAVELNVGGKVKILENGYLDAGEADAGQPEFTVVKVYTMPDGQDAVKLQRTK